MVSENHRSAAVVLATLIILTSLLFAVPAAGAPDASGPAEIHLRVETPGYTVDASGLSVAGYGRSQDPGAPALPIWQTVVELPEAGDWRLTYHAPRIEVFTLDATLAAAPVYRAMPEPGVSPAEPALPAGLVAQDDPDRAVYESDAFYPAEAVQAGPEQVQRGRRLLPLRVFPLQYNPVTGAVRYAPVIEVTLTLSPAASAGASASGQMAPQFGPAQSTASLRLRTGERGIYRLTYDELSAAGVPLATADPTAFGMTHLGEPLDVEVTGSADGSFDPGDLVLFYAQPYEGRFMTSDVYWFHWNEALPARVAERSVPSTGLEPVVTTITQTLHIEYDRLYYSTYKLRSDEDHLFDDTLYANAAAPVDAVTYTLALDDPLPQGEMVLRARLHGGASVPTNPDQSVAMRLDGHAAGTFQWDGSRVYTATTTVPLAWAQAPVAHVTLETALAQLPGLTGYWVSPDWLEASYPAIADAEGDRLYVEALQTPDGTYALEASGLATPDVRAWDVRDPHHPVRMGQLQVTPAGPSYTARFYDTPGTGTATYYVAGSSGLRAPLAIEWDEGSAWGTPANNYDYIAIVHRSLWDAIDPLLAHRVAEGFRVAKVDVQDVYDEFGFGRLDPEAIRSFLGYAYRNWNAGGAPPQYVLLVGDGHYDFKGALRPDLPELVPPYLIDIDPWIGETAADNRFVSVDGPDDFLPDMHLGRIPARSPADVTAAVDKIIAYETNAPAGDWQRRVVFVADNNADPNGNYHALSDKVRLNLVPGVYDDRAIYYRADASLDSPSEMKAAIKGAFNERALLLQWFGHGSRFRWGSVTGIFNVLDPAALAANNAWPATVTYSCWTGYFIGLVQPPDPVTEQSLGEVLLLTPGRGSVVDLSPSGLHVGEALLALDQGLARALFVRGLARFGEAADAAKSYFYGVSTWYDVLDTTVLFGDPATRLYLAPPLRYLPLMR